MLSFIIRLYMLLITIGRTNEISARHSSANTHDSALYVTNNYWLYMLLILMIRLHVLLASNHSRINENSTPRVGVSTHNSTHIVFPKPGSIKWQFYFGGTYDAFLARQKKFEKSKHSCARRQSIVS